MLFLDIFASFSVAILCGMGAGGGGLLVLYLTAIASLPQARAQGVNLLFFLAASVGAYAVNRKNKLIDLRSFAVISLSGAPAAILGAIAASYLRSELLGKMYGGLLVLSGIYYLFQNKNGEDRTPPSEKT